MYSSGPPAEAGKIRVWDPKDLPVTKRVRARNAQVRERSVKLTVEERKARLREKIKWAHKRAQKVREREEQVRAHLRKQRSSKNRGAIAPRRGTYDEDHGQTALYSRLRLDPGAEPIGNGFFADPGPGKRGTFVPASKGWGNQPLEREDRGPELPGCGYVQHGPGRWPGEGKPKKN